MAFEKQLRFETNNNMNIWKNEGLIQKTGYITFWIYAWNLTEIFTKSQKGSFWLFCVDDPLKSDKYIFNDFFDRMLLKNISKHIMVINHKPFPVLFEHVYVKILTIFKTASTLYKTPISKAASCLL